MTVNAIRRNHTHSSTSVIERSCIDVFQFQSCVHLLVTRLAYFIYCQKPYHHHHHHNNQSWLPSSPCSLGWNIAVIKAQHTQILNLQWFPGTRVMSLHVAAKALAHTYTRIRARVRIPPTCGTLVNPLHRQRAFTRTVFAFWFSGSLALGINSWSIEVRRLNTPTYTHKTRRK